MALGIEYTCVIHYIGDECATETRTHVYCEQPRTDSVVFFLHATQDATNATLSTYPYGAAHAVDE